jgi:hypothetical protein
LCFLKAVVVVLAFRVSTVPAIAAPGAFQLTGAPVCFVYTPSVALQWTASSGATSYELIRDDGQHTTLAMGALSYFDTNVVAGGPAHAYFVRAGDGGSVPTDSNTVTVPPPANQCSPPPSPFTITGNAYCYPGDPTRTMRPAIHVSWSSVFYATSYELYRNGVLAGSFKGGAGGYSLDDLLSPGGLTFTYYVIAKNAAGISTSSPVTVFAPAGICDTAPPVPVLYGNASCGTSTHAPAVTLQWTFVSGVNGWRLYRDAVSYVVPVSREFVDTAVVAGHAYTYNVSTNGLSAPLSNPITVSVPTSCASGPGAFNAAASAFCKSGVPAVHIQWSAAAGVQSYVVNRNGLPVSGTLSSSAVSFDDTGAISGQSCSYTVVASNAGGSSIALADTVVPSAALCPPPAFTLFATPSCNLIASPPGPLVTLNWSAAATAMSYLIARSGVQIGAAGGSTTSFNDTGTTRGAAYSYVVRAVGPGGSTDSNTETIVVDPQICDIVCTSSCATSVASSSPVLTAIRFALQQLPSCDASVRWNFGDGSTATDVVALHTYVKTGQFHWTVTVGGETPGMCEGGGTIVITDPSVPIKRRAVGH